MPRYSRARVQAAYCSSYLLPNWLLSISHAAEPGTCISCDAAFPECGISAASLFFSLVPARPGAACVFGTFLRCLKNHMIRPRTRSALMAAPTPMPAVAPVLRDEDDVSENTVAEADSVGIVVFVAVLEFVPTSGLASVRFGLIGKLMTCITPVEIR